MRPAKRWSGGHASTTSSRKSGSNDDPAVPSGGADDAELELAVRHTLDDGLRVRDRERDRDTGVLPLKFAEQDRDDGATWAGGRADLERAAELALLAGLELLEQLTFEGEQALGAAVEREARLGRLDAATRAIEQLASKPLLERADLEAHRRLRDPEPLGRLREALPLDHGAERCELSRVHKD